ncbi:MAG: PHP domain-containing protein, partial [Desulfobulbaceae bacterium]|nr:PHP domain-containing protein [Desulfobulbaceae bacterium]
MCIDLHVHSVYSDGTDTPAELIRLARQANLSAIALTDHDTVAGVEEMLYLGREHDILVISGVEISCMHHDIPLHMLGYGIDHTCNEFATWINDIQTARVERNQHIICNLQKLGFDIELSELIRFSKVGQTGRPHIARLLIEKKIVKNMEQAFRHYLRRGAAAWAGRKVYGVGETIEMIHRAGGLAVLAHPGTMNRSLAAQTNVIRELTGLGLDGMEIFYPSHGKRIIRRLKQIACHYNLLVTGGSDYHGDNRPGTSMTGINEQTCPPACLIERMVD